MNTDPDDPPVATPEQEFSAITLGCCLFACGIVAFVAAVIKYLPNW